MARVAVLVSNPCTIDARVIKMALAARDFGHTVDVFGTLGPDTLPYEVKDGVSYHRIEWRPAQLIVDASLLKVLAKVSRSLAVGIARFWVPFVKYRLFGTLFSKHIAALKPDIIHAHDLICLPAAMEAAKACGARVVYDAHELEVHRNPPLPFFQKRMVAKTEYKYARQADAVITVGRKVGEVLAEHIGRKDINILYNAPVVEACARDIRGDLDIPESRPLILYVGKVTMGRGVAEILDLLPKLKGVMFATVGPCAASEYKQLMTRANQLNIANRFRILPPLPFSQVVDYISGADVGIISVEPVTLSYQYCMPNKLFEMAFADIAILSNKLDEIEEFLEENHNGVVVDFEDKNALVYLLYRIFNQKDLYKTSESTKKNLAEKYSWDAQRAKLRKIYDGVLAKGKVSSNA